MANPFQKLFHLGATDLWQKKEGRVVGLDIGHSSIKAVQLRREKGQAILETYGEIALGPYGDLAVGQVTNLAEPKLVETLRDLFTEANVNTQLTSVAIPLRSSLLIIMELPDVGRAKLEKVVPIEARKYIPVPISEVELDWWVIPRVSESKEVVERKQVEVLLAAIHHDIIGQYRSVMKALGREVSFFEIETFGALRSVFGGDLSPTVIIDLGAGTTKVAIVDYGVVRLSHTVSKGSQDITLSISRSLGVEFAKAEEIKRRVGLVETVEGERVIGLVSTIVEYIFSEVTKVLTIYQHKQGRAISKIILIGGGALLKGILDVASRSFEVPVTLGNPFEQVEYPAFLDAVLSSSGPGFAVAMGLALRHLEELG
ncbi:MAG TPA: type IV pilus assembly protein PilM [Candidatus Paceibacterota bacterium]